MHIERMTLSASLIINAVRKHSYVLFVALASLLCDKTFRHMIVSKRIHLKWRLKQE